MVTKKIKPTGRDISDVRASMQNSFIEANGRLLSEEEVIQLVDGIREDLKKRESSKP